MKKNAYSLTVLCLILIFTINIFIKSQSLTNTIVFSINLFTKNIFPSLFPMFVISGILIEISLPQFLGNVFKKLFKKTFKTSELSAFVFFMSMITGCPSNAKYINDLIDQKLLNSKEAQKILLFTFFSNPLFIINTIGSHFLHDKTIGIYILISNILGNIIIGFIFKNYNVIASNKKEDFSVKDLINKINNTSIFKTVFHSIKNALDILINIFGIVSFFLIVINTILAEPKNYQEVIITGILEMTTGLKYLSIIDCSFKTKVLTSTFFISFGGLSVHSQIMNILNEKKVKYLPFLISRLLHACISTTIMLMIITAH